MKQIKNILNISLLLLCVLFFIYILPLSNASLTYVYNSKNFTFWYNQTITNGNNGIQIQLNAGIFRGVTIYKYGNQEVYDTCMIKDTSDSTLYASGSFSGLECHMDFNFTQEGKYLIAVRNSGAGNIVRAFAQDTDGEFSYPVNMSSLVVLAGYQCAPACTNLTGFWIVNYALNFTQDLGCTSSFYNSTPSEWLNTSLCSTYDIIAQNRSYFIVDNSSCVGNTTIYEYRNTTCYYCKSQASNLSICNSTDLSSITTGLNNLEVDKMLIGLIILAGLFLLLGIFINFGFWFLTAVIFGYLAIDRLLTGGFASNFAYIILFSVLFFVFGFLALFMMATQTTKGEKNIYDNFYSKKQ